MAESPQWSPRQESNLYLALRRRPFYPLNYGETQARYSILRASRKAMPVVVS